MELRCLVFSRPFIGSVILFLIGSLLAFSPFLWWTERGYVVAVDAPDDVNWTLWLPRPGEGLERYTEGRIGSIAPVDTAHGVLENVTGIGAARLKYRWVGFTVGFGDFPSVTSGNLSGGEGSAGFWIRRESTNASARLVVSGGYGWRADQFGMGWSCGGPGYHGDLEEGWNLVPKAFGDCLGVVYAPSFVAWGFAAVALVPGVVLLRRAVRTYRPAHDA